MRITNKMMMTNMTYHLQKNLGNMNDMYTQMSTGKKFQVASQSPVGAAKSVKYTSYLSDIEQYQSNADDALSRLTVTESSISSIQEVLENVRENMVKASNETLSEEDLHAILSEVNELMEKLVEMGNSSYAGEALFGGYHLSGQPFSFNEDSILTYNEEVISLNGPYSASESSDNILAIYTKYEGQQVAGADAKENMIYHVGTHSLVDVNIEGQELFGLGMKSVFSVMTIAKMALEGATSYQYVNDSEDPPIVEESQFLMTDIIGMLDEALGNVRSVKAEVGARINYVNTTNERLKEDHYTYTTLLSMNEDVDIAKVSMELANAENVYNASLSAGSKVILPTLIDFIG